MKTSTMVGTVIVVLVIVGLGWYFWSQQSPSVATSTTTTDTTSPTPSPVADQQAQNNASTTAGVAVTIPAAASTTATVTYNGKTFSPATVTIAKGGTVTFKDTAGRMWVASGPHPVHTDYDGTTRAQHCAAGATPSFDQCQGGSSYSFTFDKTGSWSYHDHLNNSAEGVVVVK